MLRVAALCLAYGVATLAAAAPSIELREGWVRAGPPSAQVLAGYGRLHNGGDRSIVLTGASSPDFARTSLHEMSMADGVMKMRELPRIEIAAHSDVALEQGGRHLMLFEPKRALKAGDHVRIELALEDGGTVEATLDVR